MVELAGGLSGAVTAGPCLITRAAVTARSVPRGASSPMAGALGLVPADRVAVVGDALAADVVSRGGHLSTGLIGTRFLFEALTRTGHLDTALRILGQDDLPVLRLLVAGLGYTALGEYWEAGQRSYSHQMFGSVVSWLFGDLAGFRSSGDGFRRIDVAPQIPKAGLDSVSAATVTAAALRI